MSSASSSSFSSGSGPVLPLIHCKYCNHPLVELTSSRTETKGRLFYRCQFNKPNGRQCSFFRWQGSYVALLIKDGHITDAEDIKKLLAIALEAHDKGISCLVQVIRDNKEELEAKMGKLEAKMEKLEAMNKLMTDENKNMAAALGKMETDLEKLKGKHLEKLKGKHWAAALGKMGIMSLFGLLLALIVWFVVGHKGGGAFRLMLSP